MYLSNENPWPTAVLIASIVAISLIAFAILGERRGDCSRRHQDSQGLAGDPAGAGGSRAARAKVSIDTSRRALSLPEPFHAMR
jgi:hypothetical protein